MAPTEQDDIIGDINVTPLVDVVLVLLVILMVTGSYILTRDIPMRLPKASSGETSKQAPIRVSIDAQRSLHVDGERVDEAMFRDRVRRRVRGRPDASATIAADGSVPHATVVHVMDLLRREQVTDFAIHVEAETP